MSQTPWSLLLDWVRRKLPQSRCNPGSTSLRESAFSGANSSDAESGSCRCRSCAGYLKKLASKPSTLSESLSRLIGAKPPRSCPRTQIVLRQRRILLHELAVVEHLIADIDGIQTAQGLLGTVRAIAGWSDTAFKLPNVGSFLGKRGRLPKLHIANVSLTDVPGVTIDREWFKGEYLHKGYDTLQIFRDWVRSPVRFAFRWMSDLRASSTAAHTAC